MLTSRLPQSTCGFASTRRPSSAAAASASLLPTVVEVSPSADTTPAHLFIGCCGGKARLPHAFPSVNSAASSCCSSACSVHLNSHPSSSSSAAEVSSSSPSLSTFRPTQFVDETCHRTSHEDVPPPPSSSFSVTDCRRSTTSVSSSTFPPPPPPLSPSSVASVPSVNVTVSCTSSCLSCLSEELTSSRESASQPSVTVVVGHHSPCVVGCAQMNAPPPPPPPPPPPLPPPLPPPEVVPPCLVPPPPLPPLGHQHGPPSSSPQSSRTPRTKLRRLQWHKIPDSRVRAVGSGCVWAQVQRQLKADSAAPCSVDLERVEELFAVGSSSSASGQSMTRPKSGPATLERRKSDQVYH